MKHWGRDMGNHTKETIDVFSNEEFFEKIICGNVDHARNCRDLLKRKGIRNCNDVLSCDNFNSIPKLMIANVLRGMDKFGYRRDDCSVEKYPEMDDYFRECFKCHWCGASLNNCESDTKLLLCVDCSKRHKRLWTNKNLEVDLAISDSDGLEYEVKGIVVDITMKNNTRIPLNIEINNCSLNIEGVQFVSDEDARFCNYCVLPGTTITLKKAWSKIENSNTEEYFVINIVDKTLCKQYTYKFGRNYAKHDYWEVDLNSQCNN